MTFVKDKTATQIENGVRAAYEGVLDDVGCLHNFETKGYRVWLVWESQTRHIDLTAEQAQDWHGVIGEAITRIITA